MIAGQDYVYVKKNKDGFVEMFLDDMCTIPYVNSKIYEDVCDYVRDINKEQVEIYYI